MLIFSEGAKNGNLFAKAIREQSRKGDGKRAFIKVLVLFMSEPITITYERVEDLSLLLAQLKLMGVPQLLDKP